jgi:hypothetical protein
MSKGKDDSSRLAGDVLSSWKVQIQPVASPSGPNATAPQLTASSKGAILSWVEPDPKTTSSHLWFSERIPSGWSTPVSAGAGDDWFVSYADPPNVMRMSDGTLVANWLILTDLANEGADLHLSYSKDDGKTWAPSFIPHHDGKKVQHAFASLFEMPGRGLGVVWLDGRDGEDTMSVRYAAYDSGWKQTADEVIDNRACECCATTTVATNNGALTAFRDRSDKEIRDTAVARFEGGKWMPSAVVHADNWEVDYCPINGPMLAAHGDQAAVAWFTLKNNQGQAYVAFSSDAGRTWGTPVRLDERGSLGRVDLEMLDDGSAVATWVEFADGHAQMRLRRVRPSGEKSGAIEIAGVPGSSSSGFPRFVRSGNELLFAWTESTATEGSGEGTLSVHTAAAPLPQ